MIPVARSEDYLFSVPKFDIEAIDLEFIGKDLQTFQSQFDDCFVRSETRVHIASYMAGQFAHIERKSIEPIALMTGTKAIRSMQMAISDTIWDESLLKSKFRSMVVEDLADTDGVLIFDESGFPKKGNDSVGVARQYCGNQGKVDNCQVGVFAAYASGHGYSFLDEQLFVPEIWFTPEYAERRKKCQIPKGMKFKTKTELAADMLLEIHKEGALPYRYILADALYGNSPTFIEAADGLLGKTFFVGVSSGLQIWLNQPPMIQRKYRYRGGWQKKTVLSPAAKKPMTVSQFGESLGDFFWYRRKVSEGAKGPIEYEFTKRRVVLCKDKKPYKTVWLIIKRTLEEKPAYRYFISNAPLSTKLPKFVWLSGMRWPIEQAFEEAKTELGMDHYEVRKWSGWHHHMLICMLAHFFLWHLKIRLGKKSTCTYGLPNEGHS